MKLLLWIVLSALGIQYLLYRKLTEEEMKAIAKEYGFQVVIRPLPFEDGSIGGECDHHRKLLWVSLGYSKVFWHELGHAVSGPPQGGIKSIPACREFLANLRGCELSERWRNGGR